MRIAIVGAGIAGLASALALSGRGHEIGLIERRTGFGETGAGIQLSPNATRILEALGLGAALARVACEPPGVVIRSLGSGREIARVGLGPRMRRLHGAPYLAVARADLHTILLDAVRGSADIRLRVGREVASLEQDRDRATLEIGSAGGARETVAADLAIGADGVGSRMRGLLGDTREGAYTGYAAYRAVLPAGAVPPGLAGPETGLWLGRGRHVVHYPVGRDRRLNLVAIARRPEAVEGWSNDEDPARILSAFADAPRELADLLRAAATWSAWSLRDLPARTLARRRVALVGDAGHPVLPYLAQGGALAIEDAATLAAVLGPDPADVDGALQRYARARLPRVRRVQDAARRNGRTYHAGGPIAFARDLVMRHLGPDGLADRYDWVYGWHVPQA